ncbi:efflux RND transporter periplasmic adaptor subunit [Paenibacillus sp. MBLB4367]|uniref:efflux RND transporter periplasmic adaptor subunit n=1 Tax=Paenibacillus sp. MBLB4367 TaxID=3384767 RepID=UPI0039083044
MELQTNDGSLASRKRWLGLLTGLLIALLAVFTLLSNTLYALMLPKVTTQAAGPGQLDQTFKGSAVIKPVEVRDLTGQSGWNVTKVLVRAGDGVRQGQSLVQYDNPEAMQQVLHEQAALNKLLLAVEKLEYDYIQAERTEDKGTVLAAKAALDNTKSDIGFQQQRISGLQAKLSDYQVMKAPFDGIVAAVNAKEGIPASAGGEPDIRLSNKQLGFQLDLKIPSDIAEGLPIGGTIEVRLPGQNNRVMEGKVASTEQTDSDEWTVFQLTVLLQDPSLASGERAEVKITKKGKADTLLISSAAVRKDQSGTYVYTVEERKGPLGNAFYARRRDVTVVSSNEHAAAVSTGLFKQETVIVESSEPLLEGRRVRVLTQ